MWINFFNNSKKTFPKGGVHPPENKLTSGKKIEQTTLPKTVSIPISQHIGKPSTPTVEPRQQVKVGEVIAKSSGFVSANIHSSVSGKVTKIDKVIDATGYKRDAIMIKVDGDEWLDSIDRSDNLIREISADASEILKKIAEAGIVGLGGATFPSHVKLSIPKNTKADYLIINGVECEPYLTADHALMLEKSEEILVGTRILMKALNVERAIVGIEENKQDAIDRLKALISKYPEIEVQSLKVQYPQGGEKQLIKALLNREVPSGGLPIDVGTVVHNVGTAFAVYEAVQKNKPLLERVVTVTGKKLSNPGNYLVRIGTPASSLIEQAGGLPENTGKVINGGPMMGKALHNVEAPITKGSSGLLVLQKSESKRGEVKPCIRCSKCVEVCPIGLEPYLLMTQAEKELYDRAKEDRVLDCIECGSCSYTCPSDRPLLDYIRLGKKTVLTELKESK